MLKILERIFCGHDDVCVGKSVPRYETIQYWTNPLCGDLVQMRIIKQERTYRCKKCGRLYEKEEWFRNEEELRRDLSFELKVRFE